MPTVALFWVGVGAGIGLMTLVLVIREALRHGEPRAIRSGALRCSLCGIDWPANAEYSRCPACLEPTNPIGGRDVHPLDCTQARSIRLHHEFERFYASWNRPDTA